MGHGEGYGEYGEGVGRSWRLEGTDLDNPSSGQAPTSCPQGLILGERGKVRGLQRGGGTGLAQLWVEKERQVEGNPVPCSHPGLGPLLAPRTHRGLLGLRKQEPEGRGCPESQASSEREDRA